MTPTARSHNADVVTLRRAAGWIATGALGAVLLAAGATAVGPRPFPVHLRVPVAIGYLLVSGGTALLVGAWLRGGWALLTDEALTPTVVYTALVAWSAPLAVGPVIGSRDAYSYVAQARMVSSGLSPYRHSPADLGASPYANGVSHVWLRARAPYGPLFVWIEGVVGHTARSPFRALLKLRMFAVAGVVLLAVLVPVVATKLDVDPRVALWAAVLNPLTLIHFVGGAHNDALMLGVLVAGLAAAVHRRWTAAIVLCTLAAAIKAPAIIALPFIVRERSTTDRGTSASRCVVEAAVIGAAVFCGLTLLAGTGWGWIAALGVPGRVQTMLSPMTAIASLAGFLADGLVPGSGSPITAAIRVSGVLLGLVAVVVAFRASSRIGTYRAVGLALGAFVILAPVVQPWYLLWGIVVLATAGAGRTLGLLVWLGATVPFLVLANGSAAANPVLVLYVVLTLVLAPSLLQAARSPAERMAGAREALADVIAAATAVRRRAA